MSERLPAYDGPTPDQGADAILQYIMDGSYNQAAGNEAAPTELADQAPAQLEPSIHAVDVVDSHLHNLAAEARDAIDASFGSQDDYDLAG